MKRNSLQSILYCIYSVLFMGIFTIWTPPSNVHAQANMTIEDCQRKLNQAFERQKPKPDKATYYKARRHCKNGNLRMALRVIRFKEGDDRLSPSQVVTKKCRDTLERVISTNKLRPSKKTYAKALTICEKGHRKAAIAVLKKSKGRPSTDQIVTKKCRGTLERAISANKLRPSKKTYRKALALCEKGNRKAAIVVLKKGNDRLSPAQITAKKCRGMLNRVIRTDRLKPSKETYAKALSVCEKGNRQIALALLQAN